VDKLAEQGYLEENLVNLARRQSIENGGSKKQATGREHAIRKALTHPNLARVNQWQDTAEIFKEMDGVGDLDRAQEEFDKLPAGKIKDNIFAPEIRGKIDIHKSILGSDDQTELEKIRDNITPADKPFFSRSIKQKSENITKDDRFREIFRTTPIEEMRDTLNTQPYIKVEPFRNYWGLTKEEALDALNEMGVEHDDVNITRKGRKLVSSDTGEKIR